ncbi:MAG: protein kinase [Brevibacillus sp.]|nr:protein kinase [Brevibacillus sp.]
MWRKWKEVYHKYWLDRPYRPGRKVGGYQIESVLGIGSYGIAYLASSPSADGLVVVKQTKPSRKGHPKGLAMQQYEKNVLESLQHPQIPRVVDHFVLNGQGFLVMSYMPGVTVEQLLFEYKRKYSEVDAVRLVRQLAGIVDYLHRQGVIHRDVRIPNVVMNGSRPYLIDFGLARFLGDPPTYAAESLDEYPEEKQVKRAVHPSSDLTALGHFLLFLLYSTYEAEETQPERSWREELSLSPDLRAIVEKLFQNEGGYRSASELIHDLDRFLLIQKAVP